MRTFRVSYTRTQINSYEYIVCVVLKIFCCDRTVKEYQGTSIIKRTLLYIYEKNVAQDAGSYLK